MRKVNIKFLTAFFNGKGTSTLGHDEVTLHILIPNPTSSLAVYAQLPDAIWAGPVDRRRLIPRSAFIEVTLLD